MNAENIQTPPQGLRAITRAAFAKAQGWSRSYVTKLGDAGRLVLDGKGLVQVAESLQRIRDTADPSKAGVAARHAAARSPTPPATGEGARHSGAAGELPIPAAIPAPDAANARAGSAYQAARAVRERFDALKSKLEYERLAGRSCEIAEVQRAGADAGALLRSSLERLPSRLAPELAAVSDSARIEALLAEAFEQVLRDVTAVLERLATAEPQRKVA